MKKHIAAWMVVALLAFFGQALAEDLEITGFVDGDFQATQGPNETGGTQWDTSFGNTSKAFFLFSGEPSEKVSAMAGAYYMQDDNTFELEQALVDWHIMEDMAVARFGKFYFPFGIEMRSAYSTVNKLVSRPELCSWLDNGFGLRGTWKQDGGEMSVMWDAAVTNGLGGPGIISQYTDANNNNKGVSGRLCVMPTSGLEVGGSGAWGRWDDAGDNNYLLAGGHVVYDGFENLDFRGEFQYFTFDKAGEGGVDMKWLGTYGQLAYKLMPEGIEYVEFAGRFGYMDPDTDTSDDQLMQLAVGGSVSPVEHLMLKGEFQLNMEGDAYKVGGETPDNNQILLQAVFGFK